ncbi:MAG: PIG-L deacetylase family protein [Armatimonadota bacterium]
MATVAIQYRIHLANEWQAHVSLPVAAPHKPGDRIIVFAPHSDDETLGCGGMLATAVNNGADVRVVLITNGDGFRIAAGRAYGTIRVTAQKCIKFAYKRQKETLRALAQLGVEPNQVTFLGYPDRGIAQLWNNYWLPDELYVSHATHVDHSPYENSLTPNAPYCGESLLNDIVKVLKADRPTDVYLPHPCDNHPDHHATYCFVSAALQQIQAQMPNAIKVHTYIVHRGDWPVPKGDRKNEPLAPPHGLVQTNTKWYSLALSPEIAARKRSAIMTYSTQVDVERNFLLSFARNNEIFGNSPVSQVVLVPHSTITIDGELDDWFGIPPAVLDTVGDYVLTELNRGGDVRAVYLCRDHQKLYVRVDTVRRLSKRLTYYINFRGISKSDENDKYSLAIRLKSPAKPSGVVWAAKNNVLEVALPLEKLNFDRTLFVQVRTKLMGVSVDNTGWHEVESGSVEQ